MRTTLYFFYIEIYSAAKISKKHVWGIRVLTKYGIITYYNSPARFWDQGKNLFRSQVIKLCITWVKSTLGKYNQPPRPVSYTHLTLPTTPYV